MKLLGRRRRLLIDRLQVKLLSINLMYTAATVLVFLAVTFGPLVLTTLDETSGPEKKLEAADRMLLLHKSIWPPVIVVIVLFGFHSILYTHRIAGPLYRFRRVLGAVGRGDLRARAGVRSKDYLRAESDVINEMIAGVGGRVRAIRGAFETLRAATLVPGRGEGPAGAAERLERRMEALEVAIRRFQLPDEGPRDEPATKAPDAKRELVHS